MVLLVLVVVTTFAQYMNSNLEKRVSLWSTVAVLQIMSCKSCNCWINITVNCKIDCSAALVVSVRHGGGKTQLLQFSDCFHIRLLLYLLSKASGMGWKQCGQLVSVK